VCDFVTEIRKKVSEMKKGNPVSSQRKKGDALNVCLTAAGVAGYCCVAFE
jgi:hypothetical protein